MVSLEFDLVKYKAEHLDLLLTFWKTSRELGFLKSNSWEVQDWICEKLYTDGEGNIWCNAYWPDYYCINNYFYKHTFVAWQIAGYELKELIDIGEIEIEVISNGNKYIPLWGLNRKRKGRNEGTKYKIKSAKTSWNRIRGTSSYKCKLRGKNITEGYIRICCVCNWKAWKILKKIDSE